MYGRYKATEYDWLGAIPSHWKWLYLSQVSAEQTIKNTGNTITLVLSLSYGQIVRKSNIDFGLSPKDYGTYQIVDRGNIILRLTDLQNDHKSLRTGLVREKGIITSAYVCLKPFENSAYLHYLLHSYDAQKFFYGLGGGVRQSIGYKDIRYIKIPLPPREEQDQIVLFLDWKVSQINKLINAKRRQIALLQEQRQLQTNTAVQRGGEGWIFRRLKTLVKDTNEKSLPKGNFYVGMENVVSWASEYIDTGITADTDSKAFAKGDVLFGKLRPYLAKVYMPNRDGVCSGEFLVLRGFDGYLPFFKYFLLSYDFIMLINASTYGAKMPRANWDFIGNVIMPFPSNKEQETIAKQLDKQYEDFDRLIAKLRVEITIFIEYRTRLISDVVTGKLDVRGVAVPEYETMAKTADNFMAKGGNEIVPAHKEHAPDIKLVPPPTSNTNIQKHNQHFDDAVMIAGIVKSFYHEKYPLGRKKVQKLLYLLRRHQDSNTDAFKKKAAGPYADEVRYKGGEPIAKKNKYVVVTTTKGKGTVFAQGEKIKQAWEYIEKWEIESDFQWLTDKFLYTKVDTLELLATVDMAICDLTETGIPISVDSIKHLIATNKEWQAKLQKTSFSDAMIDKAINDLRSLL